jgi:pentafunctional AROM polypeptide
MTEGTYPRSVVQRIASFDALTLPPHAVVIADRRLPDSILRQLPDAVLVQSGERLKTLTAIEDLAAEVLRRRTSKPLVLVALGGGSIGDAVGFLASILWRGVTLWQLPTTLLAMVDSAHGGKTAVNLGTAKNQLGTFYPAERVILVEDVLVSLPVAQRREGVVELLKALWLGDAEGVCALDTAAVQELVFAPWCEVRAQLGNMIDAAVAIKQDIVARDPREQHGLRTVLNLGHTLGHALELTTGLGHGAAVAWGMAASLRFSSREGMAASSVRRCRDTVFPLLVAPGELPSRDVLRAVIMRDKKRSDDRLRSVVLHAIGQPVVHDDITADDWIDALIDEVRVHGRSCVRVRSTHPRKLHQTLEASKSELNRALVIAAQRMGRTTVVGKSAADDVRAMYRGLRQLGYSVEENEKGYVADNLNRGLEDTAQEEMRTVHVGEGGTTLRFLLALCATSVKRSKLVVAPSLMRRPHDALLRALRSGGAAIERFDDLSGQGYIVRGWSEMPTAFSVDTSESSQFASALALLSVGADRPFTLRLLGETVSASYFDMTLSMLESSGVEYIRHGDLIAFNQTERINEKLTLEIACDASSRAVWSVAHYMGHPAEAERRPRIPRQPDAAVDKYLSLLRESQRGPVTISVREVPDLLPVLTAAACAAAHAVRFTDAGHLRHKESNRLDDLAASLRAVGVDATVEQDELLLRPSSSTLREACFRTHGDHRLVMAGVLLSLADGTAMQLDHPWSVSKSYTSFWDDVRAAGWLVERVESDSSA